MLSTTTTDYAQRASKLTEQYVDRMQEKVKKFRNLSIDALDIKHINPMEILENAQGEIDPLLGVQTALVMENFIKYTLGPEGLDETSRASLPQWVKNGLGIIAAAKADEITDKVISVQSLNQRDGRIHFLDIVSERAKGNIPDRAKLFDSLSGFRGSDSVSSYKIEKEMIGSAGQTNVAVFAGYGPVIPRTLVITDGVQFVRDDGNGNLIGDVGATGGGVTNTIDYITKSINFAFAAGASGPITANYDYNIEAALTLPEYGVSLRSKTVHALPRALGAQWSYQCIQDFMADFGIDAEPTIIEAGARLINMEKFKHVVNTLRANATGGSVLFDNTAPAAVSYRDHLKTLSLYLARLQDLVWEATQTVRPNVMVIHPSILFAVAFQDGYQGQRFANDGIAGPRFVGRLTNHDLDVYADPTYPRDQGLLTHRGAEFVSTAAVMGEYIPLYKAPVHQRGLRKDFALLTEYCIEVINGDQIATFQMVNL
jgi:hypothetical protein